MVRNLSGLEYKHWTCVLIADRHGLGSVLQIFFPKKVTVTHISSEVKRSVV